MGQIVGLNAKCKRANLNALSLMSTPVSGEIILVSSDNSMTADGQGNFDCYIVGDGTTAATALSLQKIQSTNFASGQDVEQVSIINNLVTGGSSNVLSAEQGKNLQIQITTDESIRIDGEEISGLRVGSTKINSQSGEALFYIPVSQGENFSAKYSVNGGYVRTGFTTQFPAVNVAISNYATGAGSGADVVKNYQSAVDGYFVISIVASYLSYLYFEAPTPSDSIGAKVRVLEQSVAGIEQMTDGIPKIENTLYKFPAGMWEVGNLSSSGSEGTLTTRMRTIATPFLVKAGTVISVAYGKFGVYYYQQNGTFIESSGWQTGQYTVDNDSYIRVQMATSSDDSLVPWDSNYTKLVNGILIYPDLSYVGVQETTQNVDYEYGRLDLSGMISTNATTYLSSFFSYFRTSRFLKAKDVSITYSGCTPYVYRYDKNFTYLNRILYSGKFVMDDPRCCYIKISGEITDETNFSISFSSSGSIDQIFNNRVTDVERPFLYQAHPSNGRTIKAADSTEEQYTTQKYYDSGMLMLPPNYSQFGTPVKLIIWCQSSGEYGSIGASKLSDDYATYRDFLSKSGYALLSVFGWTTKYSGRGVAHLPATPTTMASMRNAYDWVIRNYNIEKNGVYVSCKSFGGIVGSALIFQRQIPLRAVGLLAPQLSARKVKFGYEQASRVAYCEDLGFSNYSAIDSPTISDADFDAICLENADLLCGYDSVMTNVIDKLPSEIATVAENNALMGQVRRNNNGVRLKIWISKDDNAVYYNSSAYFVQSINNGCGNAEIRTMPSGTGGHHSVDSDTNALKVSSIKTKLGYTCTDIPLAYVELVDFFDQN